ncbi:MAG: glutathione S-transferase N-terminal domain-containing protein [Parvularculaceae bacterium]|nr:glutathione S-transferase N-terminal domain-containing protein [Parvularculaceae bacterium]
MITFYDFPMAPSPRRARIVLHEKEIDHETVVVDLSRQEQMGDEFRAINPRCTVPALRLDNGTVLDDNASILAWAEAARPKPPLLGTTPLEKGEVAGWNARAEFEGLLAIAEALRNSSPRMKGRALTGPVDFEQIPELAARGRARLAHFWEVLNERLAGREFLAAEQFSVADITALVALDFSRVIKGEPAEDHEEIWRWRTSLDRRPSVSA